MCVKNLISIFALIITIHCVNSENYYDYDPEYIPVLLWPIQYTVYAEVIYLDGGIVENIQAWKTESQSRIDYNHGTDISIVTNDTKYTIGPRADKKGHSIFHCIKTNLDDSFINDELETILPDAYDFSDDTKVKEIMNGIDTYKFLNRVVNSKKDKTEYLWAKYDNDNETWIPVRYENIEYNVWLGNLDTHIVKNYYSFNQYFDYSVFNPDYECANETPEEALKHLHSLNPHNSKHVDMAFEAFKLKRNKLYSDQEEHSMRRSIFKATMTRIITTNRQHLGYTLGINKFADMTDQEKAKHLGLVREPERAKGTVPFPYTNLELENIADSLPKQYDLRLLGLISPVINQESCGCCWSIGSTSAAEGALARSNGGRLLRLSNQALIDCAWTYGASGCDGGSDTEAYKWMIDFGLPTEEEYGSYTNKDGICNIANMTKLYPIRGFTDVTPYSDISAKIAVVNHGPLSVSIHATNNFLSYSGGIFYDETCDPSELNHEVTLVGYGEQDGAGFWIIKNSHGFEWGVDGYMFISMAKPCGITTEPTYVVF